MLLFLGTPPEVFIDLGNIEWQQMALDIKSDSKGCREVREELYLRIESLSLSHLFHKNSKMIGSLVDIMAACLTWDPHERIAMYDFLYKKENITR